MTIALYFCNYRNVLECFSMGDSTEQSGGILSLEFIVIFHPEGEPISPHLLCCSAFAVEGPQLQALRLASAATSARE
jgi:hypothetical protein